MERYVLNPIFRIVDEKTGKFGGFELLESFGWKRGKNTHLSYYAKEEGPAYDHGQEEFKKEACLLLATDNKCGDSMPKWEVVHQYFSCDDLPIEEFIKEETKAGIFIKEED